MDVFSCKWIKGCTFDSAGYVQLYELDHFFDGSLYELGVARQPMNMLLLAIVVLFVVDYLKYKGHDVAELFLKQDWWFRTVVIMTMVFVILLYGCYGTLYDTTQFIYFQF